MADSFFKKEKNKKRVLKKKVKDQKKEDRKVNNNKGKGFDSMIAYVDENGNLTSTPPEIKKPVEGKVNLITPNPRYGNGIVK
ncbi:MAG TPA: hypothetical protein VLB74_03300 [Flavobacterium sp.]|uniref:hypothetical protein n=1 Tax=Flavobacterium sp. TaxID=239 RepID=UPI002B969F71|nr:hypothetical protein [Flavobacterium sp.]HSD13650.1 hypothetical protein [Flavobacterium sp.]